MTRHPTARRVHRDTAAADDAFVAGVLETSVWAREHSRQLIIGGIIAAIVIIGSVWYLVNKRQKEEQALIQLTQVRAVALSGNSELAIRETEQFIARFGGTPAADEARLLLATAYLDAGQQQNAINAVRGLVDDLDTDVGVNAALVTAAAHEASGNSQQAEAVLLRVGEEGRFPFQRQEALDNVARLRLQRGDVAGAAQMYERLIEMAPQGSGERQVYELRLGEVRAMAAAGGAPAAGAPPPATAPTTTGS